MSAQRITNDASCTFDARFFRPRTCTTRLLAFHTSTITRRLEPAADFG